MSQRRRPRPRFRPTPSSVPTRSSTAWAKGAWPASTSKITTTANLRHPHLLPLFGSGEFTSANGTTLLYYVMPFVDGKACATGVRLGGALFLRAMPPA